MRPTLQGRLRRSPRTSEKAKGKAKEVYGAVAGDEGKKAEGQA
jgi:uncharacterized protein YjbJ (UPF0337 family)